MTPSNACTKLIQQFEGCAKRLPDGRFAAYPDPGTGGDPWTIGWGSTGPDIRKGTIWTQQQCDDRFAHQMDQFAAKVSALLKSPTTQHQFDAMVSFAYNVGVGNFAGSTLLKLHNVRSYADAALQFAKWNRANHVPMAGLTRRRQAEAALYRSGS
jgi:lysozyme